MTGKKTKIGVIALACGLAALLLNSCQSSKKMEADLADQAEQERQRLEEAKKEEERWKLEQKQTRELRKLHAKCREQMDHLFTLYPDGTEPRKEEAWYEIFADVEEEGTYKGNVLVKVSMNGLIAWKDKALIIADEAREKDGELVLTGFVAVFKSDKDWNSKRHISFAGENATFTLSPERIYWEGGTSTHSSHH